jgi:CubicO group peptidase (beta-lactamase class C family)
VEDIDLEPLLAKHNVPGCSLAVTEAGRTSLRAVGVTSAGGRHRIDAATIFQACSLSKPVSVRACLELVEQGMISLDEDIDRRLTGWRLPANGAWQPRVSLRQLASHTAGLTVSGFDGYPRGSDLPSTVEILSGAPPARTGQVRVMLMPGLQFHYSGGGTTVIQHLIESLTGKPARTYLDDYLVHALQMCHSGFHQPLPDAFANTAARGHESSGAMIDGGWRTYPELCAAGLWSTPSDLSNLLQVVQSLIHGSGPRAELARAMIAPQARLDATSGGPAAFDSVGMGFFLKTRSGVTTWFGHDGSNAGYRCHMIASALDGRSLVVMTNGDGGGPVVSHILDALAPALDPVDEMSAGRTVSAESGAGMLGLETERGLPVKLDVVDGAAELTVGNEPPLRLARTSDKVLAAIDLKLVVQERGDGSIVISQGGVSTVCRPSPATD